MSTTQKNTMVPVLLSSMATMLQSTKASEHECRSGGSAKCPNISIQEWNKVPYKQDQFLSNESNKAQLIRLVSNKLRRDG